ncbi:MAG: penicillin-binding protein 2 [Actinobacteria bacterium]|nr:MAG: penicillin-binding protein 2 [Actinomycetota bacterium]
MRKSLDIKEDLQSRIRVFTIVLGIIFAVILGRLWYIQIIVANEYNQLAKDNSTREIVTEAVRGNIYDRSHRLLVSNRPALSVLVTPYLFTSKKVKARLAKLLSMTPKEIDEKLSDRKTDPLKPKVIKKDIDKKLVFYLREHSSEFAGTKVEALPVRNYANNQLGAHLLGYVGEVSDYELEKNEFKDVEMGDIVGKTGVENQYNHYLMGINGRTQIETNAEGRPTRVIKTQKKPSPGSNLVLTLDINIQKVAEDSLNKAILAARTQIDKNTKDTFKATGGAVVVMDPNNGDILAMASAPTYDPRSFVNGVNKKEWAILSNPKSNYPLNNRAYTSVYAPGSTYKPFTAVAGLMKGVITPASSFSCSGSWKGSEKWPNQFMCWDKKGHAVSDLVRALSVSCDIYFYNVGYQLYLKGGESLQKWSRAFGFGQKTKVHLPYEAIGRVPTKAWKRWFNRDKSFQWQMWLPGDTINMSIGQGDLLVSPLQLANGYCAIANGGVLYKPRLVKQTLAPDGEVTNNIKAEVLKKVKLPKNVYSYIRQGLVSVTSSGTAAGVFGGLKVKVAGKTGTAQQQGKQDTALFCAYAPAEKPKYVVVVVIEQGGHGGSVAAPVARDIFSKIFHQKAAGPALVTAPSD